MIRCRLVAWHSPHLAPDVGPSIRTPLLQLLLTCTPPRSQNTSRYGEASYRGNLRVGENLVQIANVCTLDSSKQNQWALDYAGNLERIRESIKIAKQRGAKLRVGPELEVCGYGLLDHFLESEVYDNSMAMLKEILLDRSLDDIIIDLGMPVMQVDCPLRAASLLIAYSQAPRTAIQLPSHHLQR